MGEDVSMRCGRRVLANAGMSLAAGEQKRAKRAQDGFERAALGGHTPSHASTRLWLTRAPAPQPQPLRGNLPGVLPQLLAPSSRIPGRIMACRTRWGQSARDGGREGRRRMQGR